MQNGVICTRITSLYGSQPSSVVFACKTATFGPEQVSMGPGHPLSFCACKTSGLAPKLLVPVGPSSHLLFLQANIAFFPRITSLYGSQTSFVVLSTHNIVLSTRIKILYCLQPSPVVLCMHNSDFRTRITSLCWSKTPPVVFACKKAPSRPE